MNKKPVYVAFVNKKIEHDFERLKEEKFEDKQLYTFIQRAIDDLKKDPMCGAIKAEYGFKNKGQVIDFVMELYEKKISYNQKKDFI